MEQMNITLAQYINRTHTDNNDIEQTDRIGVRINLDGKMINVPLDPANRHYAEILRQVEAGTLTIEEADDGSE